jgi:hypothetical protein
MFDAEMDLTAPLQTSSRPRSKLRATSPFHEPEDAMDRAPSPHRNQDVIDTLDITLMRTILSLKPVPNIRRQRRLPRR